MTAEITITVVTSRRDIERFYRGALAQLATAMRRGGSGRRSWVVAVFARFDQDGAKLRTRLWSRLVCSVERFKRNPHFVGVIRPAAIIAGVVP